MIILNINDSCGRKRCGTKIGYYAGALGFAMAPGTCDLNAGLVSTWSSRGSAEFVCVWVKMGKKGKRTQKKKNDILISIMKWLIWEIILLCKKKEGVTKWYETHETSTIKDNQLPESMAYYLCRSLYKIILPQNAAIDQSASSIPESHVKLFTAAQKQAQQYSWKKLSGSKWKLSISFII